MPDASPPIVFAIATFLLAGLVKGVTGLGLPIVGVGLLSLVTTPAQAAALIVVPAVLTNVWQALDGPALGELLRRLWPMLAGVCLGVWAGAGVVAEAGPAAAAGLGAALALYAVYGLSPRPLPLVPARMERWLGPLAGGATGLVTAATGVSAMPSTPFLQALGLDRDRLVQALGMTFSTATLALGVSLAEAGVLDGRTAAASALAFVPAALGMRAGRRLRRVVRPETFRRLFFLALLLLGGSLMLKGTG